MMVGGRPALSQPGAYGRCSGGNRDEPVAMDSAVGTRTDGDAEAGLGRTIGPLRAPFVGGDVRRRGAGCPSHGGQAEAAPLAS